MSKDRRFAEPEDYDEEDLQFMPLDDRLLALGLEPDEIISQEDEPVREYPRIDVPLVDSRQSPVPGQIIIRLADVMREQRIVIPDHLAHAGLPNASALVRGTELALTTILPLLRKPETVRMIHVDTMARLCHFLKRQPGDLLVYKPGLDPDAMRISEGYKRQGRNR